MSRQLTNSGSELPRRDILNTVVASTIGGSFLAAGEVTAASQVDGSSTWPQLSYDSANSGHAANNLGPEKNISERWSFNTGSYSTPTPVFANGLVFATGDNYVYAISADDGSIYWKNNLRSGTLQLAVKKDFVFVSTRNGFYALNASNGSEEWKYDNTTYSAPSVTENRIYLTDGNGNIVAFSFDGNELWRKNTVSDLHRVKPSIKKDAVVVTTEDNRTLNYSLEDQSLRWEHHAQEVSARLGILEKPVISDNSVYVSSWNGNGNHGHLYSISLSDGTEEWMEEFDMDITSSPVVAEDSLFVGTTQALDEAGASLYKLSAKTGEQEHQTSTVVSGQPVLADEVLFVPTRDGTTGYLSAFSRSDLTRLWRFRLGDGSPQGAPAVANGVAYVGDYGEGDIYAVEGEIGEVPPENTGSITGTITNTDNEPLADVQIEAVNIAAETTEKTATTNTNGVYEIELPANTQYEITASLDGFASSSKEVTVNEGETHTIDFTLSEQYSEFEAAAENKLNTARDLDEDAIYFSETDSIENLLSDFREGLQSGQFEDESVPTEAVNRHRFAEETTNRLLVQTGEAEGPIGDDEQIAVTTTSFFVEIGVSLALAQLSFTDLIKNTGYGSLVPDSQLVIEELDTAIEELVALAFPEEIVDNALSEIRGTAQSAYDRTLDGEFGNAEQFSEAVSDSIIDTVANLTLQQTVETGSGFTPLQDRLPIEVLDELLSAESILNYLQENMNAETIQENGLQGNRDGAVTAEDQATAQINEIASTTSTFLNELENGLDMFSIIDNSYEFITGIREGDLEFWELAQLAATLIAATGPVVATVRMIGVLVGDVSLRLMMTANARGIVGIERGDPVGLDDIDEFLPNANDTIENLAAVDDRWGDVA